MASSVPQASAAGAYIASARIQVLYLFLCDRTSDVQSSNNAGPETPGIGSRAGNARSREEEILLRG